MLFLISSPRFIKLIIKFSFEAVEWKSNLFSYRMASAQMGGHWYKVSHQTLQRLAAAHSYCKHWHCLHRGECRQESARVFRWVRILSIGLILWCVCFQYKASKEGTVMGVAVSKISLLTHCQALTQACNYCEGECYTTAVQQTHWNLLLK